MLYSLLSKTVEENKNSVSFSFLRNLLKERLQYIALSYIYNSKYANLIFKGGSCLRICYDLPRLSEDLDFDCEQGFDSDLLFNGLIKYFLSDQNYPEMETQKYPQRLYLKFPILKKLGVFAPSESDKLYLKIELSTVKQCPYKTEVQPIFKDGFSFLVNRYSLPDLFTGKLEAILQRSWFKGKNQEITIKGRDYFDLYWYLSNKVRPNINCLFYKEKLLDEKTLWSEVAKRVKKIKASDLEYDLAALMPDRVFVKNFCQNYSSIVLPLI